MTAREGRTTRSRTTPPTSSGSAGRSDVRAASTARHVRKNRRYWEDSSENYQREHASQLEQDRPVWGTWGIPESELSALGDVDGLDVLEYGCGGGQWCRWLAAMGARAFGLDLSLNQLRHARELMVRAGVAFSVVNADAERVPIADASFDLVMCDHGAMTFADPYSTVPEVGRLLRPGGRLVFNHASPIHFLCWDDATDRVDTTLHHDYFGMRKWDEETVDFNLPYGEWIALFVANGFEIEGLVEPRPTARARTTYPWFAPREWARRYPVESLWRLRKTRA